MAKKTINAQMKQRRDTKANWAATNPVLLDGELGIVSDDPNLYKVGDGATAWNSLPFRGFDGTLAQELGTSPNAVISQKVVSEKLTELESGVEGIIDFAYDSLYKVDTSYSVGVLTELGLIDSSKTDFFTSDFVSLADKAYCIRTGAAQVYESFLFVAFYDADKNFMYGVRGNIKYSKNVLYLLNIRPNVSYVRYSISNETENQGLYVAQNVSPIHMYENVGKKHTYETYTLLKDILNENNLAEEIQVFTNSRLKESQGIRIDAEKYCIAVMDIPENMRGTFISYKGTSSQYVPVLKFFEGRSEDYLSYYNEIFTSERVNSGNIVVKGSVIIPYNARVMVVQCLSNSVDIDKQKQAIGIYRCEGEDLKRQIGEVLKRTNSILSEQNNSAVYSNFDNFVDKQNLIGGTYLLNKRINISNHTVIDADGFCLLLIDESQIKDNQHINIICSGQLYVPGVLCYRNYNSDYSSFSGICLNELEGENYTPELYKKQVEIPNDTRMIVIQCNPKGLGLQDVNEENLNTIKTLLCASFSSSGFVSSNELNEKIEEQIKQNHIWHNKAIWWCGTSIPAGGYWDVNREWAYPQMVGKLLQAKRVFNEAVGSSQANGSMSVTSYEVLSRRMGHTIAQKMQIFNDCWIVDDINKSVSKGERQMGISQLPSITTYESACTYRRDILSHSYEIKLISKYLISDETENREFLMNKFGSLYDTLIALHPNAYLYQGDIDLFVIDHSNNDWNINYTDINTTDIKTYVGAINTYIRLIFKYKPHSRVALISNYVDSPEGTIKTEGDIAENWNLPYLNLTKYLNFNTKFKILTRGYWDSNSIWHDDGFEWNDDGVSYETNLYLNGMSSRVKGDLSLSQVKANINPQKLDGIWYWEGYQRDIYIRDGLHPHTDTTGRCFRMYSEVIAKFLETVGS